jgi:hypothetical protein
VCSKLHESSSIQPRAEWNSYVHTVHLGGLLEAPMYGTAFCSLSSKIFLYFIVGGSGRCVNVLETELRGGMWLVLKCNVKSIVETESPVT